MTKYSTFAENVLNFNEQLANIQIKLPEGFKLINPFSGLNKDQIEEITTIFYNKFYNDRNKRYVIFGSSPARRGSAIVGVPFEDATHLQQETGITVDDFHINKSSSNFLYDVINRCGGCDKFYSKFYMNFVCPLGIEREASPGHSVNCNYYENKKLKQALYDFIVNSIKKQLEFNIDKSICYCIGSGENYKFLNQINNQFHFFKKIISLEHPRFIMQYNSKNKENFLEKYLNALSINEKEMNL